jgi:hypothetical protein
VLNANAEDENQAQNLVNKELEDLFVKIRKKKRPKMRSGPKKKAKPRAIKKRDVLRKGDIFRQ